jgi:hypothetical protein
VTAFPFDAGAGPRLHALIVAAGGYADAQDPAAPLMLRPAPGVTASGLALADFLVARSARLKHPLGSIELLASSAAAPVHWQGRPVDRPTLAAIEAAVRDWLDRAEPGGESLGLVYFGGHASYKGGLVHYFADDAGATLQPFDRTVRLHSFKTGLSTRAIPLQWLLFDCCQSLPAPFAQELEATTGSALLAAPADAVRPVGRLLIEAAAPGFSAIADAEGTQMMQALFRALSNDAAAPIDGGWWAKPSLLMDAMNGWGEATFGRAWVNCEVTSNSIRFDRLHRLDGPPAVRLRIVSSPRESLEESEVELVDVRGTRAKTVDQMDCLFLNQRPPLLVEVAGGFYTARARLLAGGEARDSILLASPPQVPVELSIP